MKFHLNFSPEISDVTINHQSRIQMIGSCFSEHIGQKLIDLKFNLNTNPFGIIFNPQNIAILISRINSNIAYTKQDVFEHNNLWFCYECHSSINAKSSEDLLNKLNHQLDILHDAIKKWDFLFITFGSAYYYNYLPNQITVANCHKLPQHLFEKKLASLVELNTLYSELIKNLTASNPKLKIIFSVSPVKHLRDGIIENNLSKSTLLLLCHQLTKQNSNCKYFPSYELVNDDLRDYRFYEQDMAHPNKQAINYVWEKFSSCYFNKTTIQLNEQLTSIHQAFQHKVLKADSDEFKNFKLSMHQKCTTIQTHFSFIDLSKEIKYFSDLG